MHRPRRTVRPVPQAPDSSAWSARVFRGGHGAERMGRDLWPNGTGAASSGFIRMVRARFRGGHGADGSGSLAKWFRGRALRTGHSGRVRTDRPCFPLRSSGVRSRIRFRSRSVSRCAHPIHPPRSRVLAAFLAQCSVSRAIVGQLSALSLSAARGGVHRVGSGRRARAGRTAHARAAEAARLLAIRAVEFFRP